MPDPINEVFCPRCDRAFGSTKSRGAALTILSSHVDKAHPDMENYIKEGSDL